MKTLLLMRHAKSSWKEPNLQDHERPLNKRGLKDAPMMAELLCEKELIPQKILSSSAKRAESTAEILAKACHFTNDITYLNAFYMAEPETYLNKLREMPDELERVMIIGHNPGLEGLLQILSGQVESLPTAAIAHLVLPINRWQDLNENIEGNLVEFWCPRDFKEKHKK
jgi:phosphohistidine phosphatase